MQRRSFVRWAALAPAALCAGLLAQQPAQASPGSDHAAALATMQWLQLLDTADYAGSWAQAGAPFKGAVTADEWTRAASGTRGPLGALKERKNRSVRLTKTLPGVPDGDYAVLEFDTAFEKKAQAVETLTLLREADGAWRVVGYFIR